MKKEEVDPTVLKCLAEIKEVFKKYDVGGHVVVTSQNSIEFEMLIPSWCCLIVDENTGGLRFRSVRGQRSEEEQRAEQHTTAKFLLGTRDVLTHQAGMLIQLGSLVEDTLGVRSEGIDSLRVGKAPEPIEH